MLTKSPYAISTDPKQYAATAVPSVQDWERLWDCWDLVTQKMIPEKEILSEPIKLRNCCLFYLGHIPTFLDIHLTRTTNSKPTPPDHYPKIFERGIDPDVDNPEQCHDHSEVPEEWPQLAEILKFQQDVRLRVKNLYSDGSVDRNPKLHRILPFGFEHEVMHLETFLYMLIQSDHVQAPSGTMPPDFAALAQNARSNAGPARWLEIPTATLKIGRKDSHDDYTAGHFFSWDTEYPTREVNVPHFEAQSRPITNEDYVKYLLAMNAKSIPASWTTIDRPDSGFGDRISSSGSSTPIDGSLDIDSFIQNKAVRTVYGPVPLRLALDWPVSASYDELNGCASYMGGRIPTEEEVRSIYNFGEQLLLKDLGSLSTKNIPAVNGQLSHNGVHQTPPPEGSVNAGSGKSPEQVTAEEREALYANFTGLNIGFQAFHPVAVTAKDSNNGLRLGGMGGVWEWTSTPLRKNEGYVPMDIYPAYSSDFFDGKHNIVLGGSWATHPRYAGRKSCVNWYQRNYPYAWAGARIVRDL